MSRITSCFLLFGASVTLLLGCGGPDRHSGPTGTVSGSVTFEGEPAPAGSTIQLDLPDKGFTATGQVGEDGQYSLVFDGSAYIPTGEYRVSVNPPLQIDPPTAEPASENSDGPAPVVYENLPAKYRSPTTSGETYTVKEGQQTYDLDMKGS